MIGKKGKPAFILVSGVIFLILVIFLPGYTKLQELRDKNRDLQAKIDQARLDNLQLEQEILRMEQDPVYQEEVVRHKLGVVRKGEGG